MEAQIEPSEPDERDSTDEWRITPGRSVATVAELEGRIDVALATARSAEEAALEIGAASLEAAEQARRAAALAERASFSAARAAEGAREASLRPVPAPPAPMAAPVASATPTAAPVAPTASSVEPPSPPASNGATARRPDPFEERLTAFRLRAERVMVRLQRIELGAGAGEGPAEIVRLG